MILFLSLYSGQCQTVFSYSTGISPLRLCPSCTHCLRRFYHARAVAMQVYHYFVSSYWVFNFQCASKEFYLILLTVLSNRCILLLQIITYCLVVKKVSCYNLQTKALHRYNLALEAYQQPTKDYYTTVSDFTTQPITVQQYSTSN